MKKGAPILPVAPGAQGAGGAAPSAALTARDRVLAALERAPEQCATDGALQASLPMLTAGDIAIVLQGLMRDRRVEAYAVRLPFGAPRSSASAEHTFKLVSADKAARLKDLEENDLMVLQYVERGSTQGVWVRNIKINTRLQHVQINKILRKLENRKLVKPVKCVAFKNRRMYMLYGAPPPLCVRARAQAATCPPPFSLPLFLLSAPPPAPNPSPALPCTPLRRPGARQGPDGGPLVH